MSALPVKSIDGADQGTYELSDDLLVYDRGAVAMSAEVTAYRAAQRTGSANTKHKSEVAGSGAKPWKQKGLGRARAGYKQSPIWRGGAVAFGPKPRDYSKPLNKKASRLAFRRSISEKVAAGQITVVEDFSLDTPKTRQMADALKQMGARKAALFIFDQPSDNIALSARNIPKLDIVRAQDVNTYQILRYPELYITRSAMAILEQRLARAKGKKEAA